MEARHRAELLCLQMEEDQLTEELNTHMEAYRCHLANHNIRERTLKTRATLVSKFRAWLTGDIEPRKPAAPAAASASAAAVSADAVAAADRSTKRRKLT